jgi:pilus assembly protein CpaC
MFISRFRPLATARVLFALRSALIAGLVLPSCSQFVVAQSQMGPQPVIHRIQTNNERLEMLVNSSRIISLDRKIPQVQVNNPEILALTPLSPTEIQVSAKKAGVTQINIWSEDKQIYTVDVLVTGDARELAMLLRSQFPRAALKITPVNNSTSVIISGYVDDPTMVPQIIAVAEDYYPKVHNHVKVGGGQQVLLQVRLMEVSRTKLRALGVDWANIQSNGSFVSSSPSQILKIAQVPLTSVPVNGIPALGSAASSALSSGGETFSFGIIEPSNSFFAFLNALRQEQLAKILAEPNLVTVSGRPAYFNEGGEIPIIVPQSLGTVSTQYRPYGTQVDFVPIVLGNGAIRLEVRPRISQLDYTHSVTFNGTTVPALVVREVDTGVEMRAGQTLAIAGLVQNQVETTKRGIPWLMDLPYVGGAFRQVTDQINEVELLIMVTPQLIEAMDPNEVPLCGPGLNTTNPTDLELYGKGYTEVPNLCMPGGPQAGPPIVGGPTPADGGANAGQGMNVPPGPGMGDVYDGRPMPGGNALPPPNVTMPNQAPASNSLPTVLPPANKPAADNPPVPPAPADTTSRPVRTRPAGTPVVRQAPSGQLPASGVSYDRTKPYNPPRTQAQSSPAPAANGTLPGFIGATGYDVLK